MRNKKKFKQLPVPHVLKQVVIMSCLLIIVMRQNRQWWALLVHFYLRSSLPTLGLSWVVVLIPLFLQYSDKLFLELDYSESHC